MSTTSRGRAVTWGAGLAAAGVGAAAGAVLGLAAERAAVGRPLGRQARSEGRGEAFGSVRGQVHGVVAGDGTRLHAEVDEPDAAAGEISGLTVVFCHGYSNNLDTWHFQRLALRGPHRLVLWDQRGHGRSPRGPKGSATIDQIGADLLAVLSELAPSGPLVLIGHSMGGMSIMSLAASHPDLVRDRVVGVCLMSTSAGGLSEVDFGLAGLGRLLRRTVPGAARLLSHTPRVVERTRRLGGDLEQALVRRYAFGSAVPPATVEFLGDMIRSTQFEVISDYLETFGEHDKRAALEHLQGTEVLVITGADDVLIPLDHSESIVDAVPTAEFVVVTDGGHMLMIEHPDLVDDALLALVDRARRAAEHGRPEGEGRAPRRTVSGAVRRRRRGAA